MTAPAPTQDFLARQVRWAMGRGLPAQVAEDVVFAAWEKASGGFDASRGNFEAFMQAVVRRDCAYWWRQQGVQRRAEVHLRLVEPVPDAADQLRAHRNQTALLDALDDDERAVFSGWVLQKHLGKGQITSVQVGASLGLDPRDYENAKRRLRDQLHRLMDRFGWSVADILEGETDVDRTG